MLPIMYYNYFLKENNEINRLIDTEYKNLADREFVKYFIKNNKQLPKQEEIFNGK